MSANKIDENDCWYVFELLINSDDQNLREIVFEMVESQVEVGVGDSEQAEINSCNFPS